MGTKRLAVLLISYLLTGGCAQQPPIDPSGDPLLKSEEGRGVGQYTGVMTRNLYVGMNFRDIIEASPAELLQQVYASHQLLIQSLPAERMDRIAAEIAAEMPDVVGLQEAFQVRVDGVLQYDYLQLLLDALNAHGASYEVAVILTALEIGIPALPPAAPPYLAGVADRQAIIVRRGLQYSNAQAVPFQTYFSLDLGIAPPIPWRRGWTSVDVKSRGREFRFINTHLETEQTPGIQVAQGDELISAASGSPLPVILAGDFNSAANPAAPAVHRTDTYGNILTGGFADAWVAWGGGTEAGLTCCHDDDLMNEPSVFDRRTDLVFFDGLAGAGGVDVVGDEEGGQTSSGLWPSDHAGVDAQLRLP
jgi:endonuclease/exonuclease/phosphatase family metal-dependent hydrolase